MRFYYVSIFPGRYIRVRIQWKPVGLYLLQCQRRHEKPFVNQVHHDLLMLSPADSSCWSKGCTPPKFNSSPLFQPPFFRVELLNFGGVENFGWLCQALFAWVPLLWMSLASKKWLCQRCRKLPMWMSTSLTRYQKWGLAAAFGILGFFSHRFRHVNSYSGLKNCILKDLKFNKRFRIKHLEVNVKRQDYRGNTHTGHVTFQP